MKIIQFLGAFNPGGAEILIKDLAIKMNNSADVEVWAMSEGYDKEFENRFQKELNSHGIKTKIFNKKYRKDYFKFIIQLRKEIKNNKIDIINTHFEEVTVYTIFATIFMKIKIIQTIHNTKIKYKMLQKIFISKFIDKYISISNKVTEILKKNLMIADKNIALIFNGIDLGKFTYHNRVISKDVRKIAVIGRLEKQKGHENLIISYAKVIEKLKETNKEIPIIYIYGMGSLKDYLEGIIKKNNLQEYIKLMGISNNIFEVLKDSDIYIMPSLWEGLSISLIEAVATSIPIIATNVGSNGEIIKNNYNGLLVEENNVDELERAIINMINDYQLRCKLSKNCLTSVEKLSIDETTNNYMKLYNEVLKI